MFNNDDASKIGSSEFGDCSNWGDASNAGKSIAGIGENNQDKSRQFMENYDIVEGLTIGAHSVTWKVRSRITGQFFCLKVIKK
jgi:hypothetical protein